MLGGGTVVATIIPDPGEFTDTLKALLDLSTRPRDLRIIQVQAIEVPDEVAERYERYLGLGQEDSEPPKKRGPGRPRKNPLPEETA